MAESIPQQPIEVWCRVCGCQMAQRRNRESGRSFWGCSAYPKCVHTMTDRDAADQHDPPSDPDPYDGEQPF